MTKHEMREKIKDLKEELKKELETNGATKRAIFLQATINHYTTKVNG